MANQSGFRPFPSQAEPDHVKNSMEYGLQVANAIESEWFYKDSGSSRYYQSREDIHRHRLYARGEQSVQKYKDELRVNDDLSYYNLDWEPVPIIPKFVDIVVNGMQDRLFSIKAQALDPISTSQRTSFVESMEEDIISKDFKNAVLQGTDINIFNHPEEQTPDSIDELELYMQLEYKQGIEIAIEQAVDNVFLNNKYSETKEQVDYDQVILGIGAAKHTYNSAKGVSVEYVDPADLVYSYTEKEDFSDCYYFGEVKRIRANELHSFLPDLDESQIKQAVELASNNVYDTTVSNYEFEDSYDNNTLNLLFFSWKAWETDNYKVKETSTGGLKALKKDDTFNPPKDKRTGFKKMSHTREVIYEGIKLIGVSNLVEPDNGGKGINVRPQDSGKVNKHQAYALDTLPGMLMWKKSENMTRPDSSNTTANMNYVVRAPRLYKGRIDSLVGRMIKYADLIQLTHLKLQQNLQRQTPSGVYLNADGFAEIDLGNGTSYNPQEALNMYFQTGSIIGRSLSNPDLPDSGGPPIQPTPGSSNSEQIQTNITVYNHYLNMIRDVTGINEARDGSDPDPYSLVGVQKLAAANSNTATRHVLRAGMEITKDLADGIVLRLKDVSDFHPKGGDMIRSLGKFTVGSLKELDNLHHHDFGIFLELSPDEEEKAMLENNIQQALSKDQIFLEDAIDVREIKNIKLANRLLKVRRLKKEDKDNRLVQENLRIQSQEQAKAGIALEREKMKALELKNQSEKEMELVKLQAVKEKTEFEMITKKSLMDYEAKLKKEYAEFYKSQVGPLVEEKSPLNAPETPTKNFESNNDTTGPISFEDVGRTS